MVGIRRYGRLWRSLFRRQLCRSPRSGRNQRESPGSERIVCRCIAVVDGAKPSGEAQHWAPGERVSHKVFGEGVIEKVSPMGNDSLLQIAFDKAGVKKIMANFAKLKRLSE